MTRSAFPRFSRRTFLKSAGIAAVGVSFAGTARRGWSQEEKRLNVYNWDTYIGETTLSSFTDATGIEVQYDLYANNEELFAKMQTGNPGYDVIFPSDYMVATMISRNMVEPIDHSKIPNLSNIDPDPNFTDPAFNPGLKYGVPYMWGTIGIGYRKSAVETPTSWADTMMPAPACCTSPMTTALMPPRAATSRASVGSSLLSAGFPISRRTRCTKSGGSSEMDFDCARSTRIAWVIASPSELSAV